ncbi:3302_t:CDS:2 [Gigaspora margarita]|uniref:3302_t:CDS:1 n=1 Tax=Gigaspora margarita TaxID=4874 RepID=A0ABN7WI01_GIGMA|nr:3302_t:CDS:2 [Gigaspora margarita]
MGIPAAKLYAASDQLLEKQEILPEDPKVPKCGICDNCKRCIINEIIWCNISKDMIQILDMVNKLLEFSNDPTSLVNFGHNDIVNVFMKANNKNPREKLNFLIGK